MRHAFDWERVGVKVRRVPSAGEMSRRVGVGCFHDVDSFIRKREHAVWARLWFESVMGIETSRDSPARPMWHHRFGIGFRVIFAYFSIMYILLNKVAGPETVEATGVRYGLKNTSLRGAG